MREWYRRKLRELSERRREQDGQSDQARSQTIDTPARANDPAGAGEPALGILTLTAEVEPGDRKLGELLQALDLVDGDTLKSLLVEARRQRRSLRQVLLAGGYLTLYQMALIETENLGGLVLGPLRVIDRLRITTHEAVYRVFDPRQAREAILRHLAEAEMDVSGHTEEFRERFRCAAAIKHPHVAGTFEVLEIADRPAVLQESLTGLHSTDWPGLAAVPGVWFRLLTQAALGLHALHQAGMVHDHLHAGAFLLTSEGTLKLCGVGEPSWLALPPLGRYQESSVASNLAEFARVVAGWAALAVRRKGVKPLPEPLHTILGRLGSEDPGHRFADLAELLEALDLAGETVPPNPEAWDRLLRYVRDHAAEDAGLRQSA